MIKNYCHRANQVFTFRLCTKNCPFICHIVIILITTCYQIAMIYIYTLYIPCRPSYQGLVFDEQSSTHGTDMRYIRIHRQSCGTAINGQPQAHGVKERTHRL